MLEETELKRHRVNGASAALLTTEAASLWPYKLISFMLERLIKEGNVNLQTNTAVTGVTCISGSRLRYQLHTHRGSINARHVILATNAYTSHLLPEFEDLIVPDRAYMSALTPPNGSERLAHSYGFVGANGGQPAFDDYLIQRPFSGRPNTAGHLMFGGGRVGQIHQSIGQTDDSFVDEGAAKYLCEQLPRLLILGEEDEKLEATHLWSGIIGRSKDHSPWVGEIPNRPGMFLCGGYSGQCIVSSLMLTLSK